MCFPTTVPTSKGQHLNFGNLCVSWIGLLFQITQQQLETFLTEAERIVNSRPLTHISDNVDDMDALTPNHILIGLHRSWASIEGTDATDITSRKQWKQVQALRAMFWT